MAIEIVSFPAQEMVMFHRYVRLHLSYGKLRCLWKTKIAMTASFEIHDFNVQSGKLEIIMSNLSKFR